MLCRLSTKELAKESGALAKVRVGTKKVAKMEGRTLGRKVVARTEAKGKRKVARERPEHVERVAHSCMVQDWRQQHFVRHR